MPSIWQMILLSPFVDVVVIDFTAGREARGELTSEDRARLLELPGTKVCMGAEKVSLLQATEMCSDSLVRAIEHKDPAAIEFPGFAR